MCNQNVPFLWARGISEISTRNFRWIKNRPGCHSNVCINHEKKKALNFICLEFQCYKWGRSRCRMVLTCIPTEKLINSCSFNVMDSRFWKAFVLPVHAKTIDGFVWVKIEINYLKRNYSGKHTDLSAKPSSWPYAKVLFYYCSLSKFVILDSTLELFVNSNLQFLCCF